MVVVCTLDCRQAGLLLQCCEKGTQRPRGGYKGRAGAAAASYGGRPCVANSRQRTPFCAVLVSYPVYFVV